MLILIFISGLVIGSFLNVCIHRIPRKESIIWKPSYCPSCGNDILWRHKIPLLSYIILGGNCYYCKCKISWQYPLVEVLTALIILFLYFNLGLSYFFLSYTLLFCFLIVISFIDIEHQIIPNSIIISGVLVAITVNLMFNIYPLDKFIGSGLLGGAILWLLGSFGAFLFHKQSIGGGDIKLAILIGLFVGWKELLIILTLAFLCGAIFGVIGIGIGKLNRQSKIPFAPFIAFGSLCYMIYHYLAYY